MCAGSPQVLGSSIAAISAGKRARTPCLRLERSLNEVRGLNSGDTVHVNSEPAVVRVGPGPLCAILSRERAKLCYRWQPAVIECWATGDGRLPREEDAGEPFRMPGCPVCANQVVTPDGVPLTDAELARRKRTCDHCGTVTDYDSEPASPAPSLMFYDPFAQGRLFCGCRRPARYSMIPSPKEEHSSQPHLGLS